MSDSTTRDGGPAFPLNEKCPDGGHYHSHEGMTLRDYFAAQALIAMEIKDDGNYSRGDHERGQPAIEAQWRATAAYRVADAMLKAREAK